jgi:N-acetylmuramoyl-L-alanine amidase
MLAPPLKSGSKLPRLLAWIGLALFVASFVWLQLLPERSRPPRDATTQPAGGEGLGVVVIDPGHGGQDSGMIHGGVLEKDLALDVARRVDRILQTKSVPTVLTRLGDTYVSLAGRAAAANREENALFVSIHFDDAKPTATGVATYYAARQNTGLAMIASWVPFMRNGSDQTNVESQSLAGFIQEALIARTRAVDRGVRAEQFYVIANVRHPSVLIEGGFLTNKDEVTKLLTEEYREQIAAAIADGVAKYRDLVRERRRSMAVQRSGA